MERRYLQEHATRVKLEGRLNRRRHELHLLNECRTYERETERGLIQAMTRVYASPLTGEDPIEVVGNALAEYGKRMGPRT